jgi:hypothetical protein
MLESVKGCPHANTEAEVRRRLSSAEVTSIVLLFLQGSCLGKTRRQVWLWRLVVSEIGLVKSGLEQKKSKLAIPQKNEIKHYPSTSSALFQPVGGQLPGILCCLVPLPARQAGGTNAAERLVLQ